MRYGRSIVVVGLVLGLVGLAPVVRVVRAQTVAQAVDPRKAEADRLREQGIQQAQTSQYEAALQSFEKALKLYRTISDRNGEAKVLNNLGIAYRSLSQYEKAIAYLEQALPIFQQVKDRNGEAKVLNNLGIAYRALSQYEKAIAYYEQARLIYQQVRDHNGEANVLMNLGIAYRALSQYEKAIAYYEQARLIYQQVRDHNGEANVLINLGNVYAALSQYEKAIAYYERALPIFQQVKDRNGEAKVLNNLGTAYRSLSQYEKAITYYEQARPIFQQVEDRNGEATVLMNLGTAYLSLSQYEKAIAYYEQAQLIYQQVKNRNGEALLLMNLGNAYDSLSQYEKAIAYYERALPIFQQVKDRNGEALLLMNLGNVYAALSQYEKAIAYYERALPIFQQVKDHNGEAKVLMNLGEAYRSLSQYDKAITYYKQARPIFQQVKDRNGEAKVLNNLGNAYLSLSQYEKAIAYYEQARPIFQQVRDRNGEAKVLNNLGEAYRSLSQYDKAITYYEQARPIYQQVKDRNGEAKVLMNLGNAYGSLSQYEKAIAYYEQALPILQQVKDRESEGKLFSNLGNLFSQRKDPELAIVFYKQSVNVRETIRQDIRKLPRESQEAYTQSVAGTYRALADLLIQQRRLPEAQAVLELLKLHELREFTRDSVGIDSPGISLAKIEEAALKQILNQFANLGKFAQAIDLCEKENCSNLPSLLKQRDTLYTVVTQELKQQRAILAKHFSTESSTLTPAKLNSEARKIVNAQPGTVLIYPLILKDKIQFLLAVKTGDGGVTFRPFESQVSAEKLFKTIKTFREQLGVATSDLTTLQASSQQLYQWLIKPLESELNPEIVKHLVFAPDSITRYLPLAALYDGNQYLIQRFTVSTITAASETDTKEETPRPTGNQPLLLAMGASNFPNLNPLVNVPAELDAITRTQQPKDLQGIYPGREFLNTSFNYEALQTNLHKGTYRILHLATHGAFKPGRPEDSYLVPGRGQNLTTELIDQLGNYGLSKIHLVVLSACQTAVGDRASDGMEIPGISYFFLKNDVKSVMASLWNVNDASTALMMQQFYKHLANGMTKAQAIQQVQKDFMLGNLTAKDAKALDRAGAYRDIEGQPPPNSFIHPYYWAPFILIGNSL
ncbi:tetratricopeptide repeat protein [Alkalinema sp. FACHB-956]|uniref:CHAT domain-containing protein n=1 Tax=Alkalinema sp. FACHB-956 TaxID=2692768 RepID=UPI0016867951|nr:tetratricopeptide repeat protein [Alkalinema sp. FACHB-956]MBD2328080.1 tetratricopeptide repeat protein [Alkalinema sp. FACHB-956]